MSDQGDPRQLRLLAQRHAVALASAVAHDVNNPVAFLSLASAELRRMVDRAGLDGREAASLDFARIGELAREIDESAGRLGRIVQELRLFTRGSDPANGRGVALDLSRLIDGALTLAAVQLGQRARITVGPVDPELQAPVSFGYALLNVFLSIGDELARRSVEGGNANVVPTVHVEAACARDSEIVVTIDVSSQPPPADQPSHASQFSLDLARDILHDSSGALETTTTSTGQLYKLTLPASAFGVGDGAADRASESSRDRQSTRDVEPVRHRVLVIDDETALARALARSLAERHDVDVAFTAVEALNLLRAARYDAIVCDLHLPERSGTAIHEEVARVSPDQARRFIFTTGANAVDDAMHAQAIASGCPILEKPFDGRRLEAEVARLLAS